VAQGVDPEFKPSTTKTQNKQTKKQTSERLHSSPRSAAWAGGVAQVVERLPSKHKALNSTHIWARDEAEWRSACLA
jgi:hypothetical protein